MVVKNACEHVRFVAKGFIEKFPHYTLVGPNGDYIFVQYILDHLILCF